MAGGLDRAPPAAHPSLRHEARGEDLRRRPGARRAGGEAGAPHPHRLARALAPHGGCRLGAGHAPRAGRPDRQADRPAPRAPAPHGDHPLRGPLLAGRPGARRRHPLHGRPRRADPLRRARGRVPRRPDPRQPLPRARAPLPPRPAPPGRAAARGGDDPRADALPPRPRDGEPHGLRRPAARRDALPALGGRPGAKRRRPLGDRPATGARSGPRPGRSAPSRSSPRSLDDLAELHAGERAARVGHRRALPHRPPQLDDAGVAAGPRPGRASTCRPTPCATRSRAF